MPRIIILFTWLLAMVGGHQILEFPDTFNRTACIPLSKLQDASVQRGLGELRNIKKVNLYLIGNDPVDVTVAVATSFRNEDFTKPSLHRCANYTGTANDVLVSMTCHHSAGVEGSYGYAVFVKFLGDVRHSSAAICQLEIHFGEKDAEEKRAQKRSIALIFGIACLLIVLAGIFITTWYWLTTRLISAKEEQCILNEDKPQRATLTKEDTRLNNQDDYDDDVFVLE